MIPNIPEDAEFKRLVESGNYEQALKRTCKLFPILDCSRVRVSSAVHSSESTTNASKAVTNIFNQITVYPGAFKHRTSRSIHPGWLAAVIWHEMTHVKQSGYVRWINGAQMRIVGNYRYDAGLELEAWMSMIAIEGQFPMDCSMLVEIQENIVYYDTVLKNNGRRPMNYLDEDNYEMSGAQVMAFMNNCKAILVRKYGATPDSVLPVEHEKSGVSDVVPLDVQKDMLAK